MTDQKPLNTDMDANRWASEFVSLHGGDHELMRAWFANALMCGWDNHYWTTPEYKAVVNGDLTRAAELLQRQALVPISVSERMPEPSTKVLAYYFNDLGKGRTICAIWVPAKSRSNADGDDDFTEYDEEDDKFYWPEGWYEAIENWDELGWVKVYEGEVVCWQPLPKWPAHALPLPEASE